MKNDVIIIGGGAAGAGMTEDIKALAEKIAALETESEIREALEAAKK